MSVQFVFCEVPRGQFREITNVRFGQKWRLKARFKSLQQIEFYLNLQRKKSLSLLSPPSPPLSLPPFLMLVALQSALHALYVALEPMLFMRHSHEYLLYGTSMCVFAGHLQGYILCGPRMGSTYFPCTKFSFTRLRWAQVYNRSHCMTP